MKLLQAGALELSNIVRWNRGFIIISVAFIPYRGGNRNGKVISVLRDKKQKKKKKNFQHYLVLNVTTCFYTFSVTLFSKVTKI